MFRRFGIYGVTTNPKINNSFDFFNTKNKFILASLEIDGFVYLKSIDIVSAGQGEVELSVRKFFCILNVLALEGNYYSLLSSILENVLL